MLSTALLLAASMTIGQSGETADPNLKQLTPLVGSWKVTFDWPGMPFDEAKVTYRWKLKGRYLEARWSKTDGTDLGPELFAWDPIKKSIRMWGFDPESFYEATWSFDGKKWAGKFSGTRFTGEETESTIHLEFQNDSSISVQHTPKGADKPRGFAKFTRVPQGE